VLALGHPQETVWSFTQGVVGSLEQGAIQHDAAISHGSSGGPLLNARGEIVGINIAKVLGEPSGLAFARPISLAARYLGEGSVVALPLDLSSPEASAVSCWRAQEIGRVEVGDCFDWETDWDLFLEVEQDAERIVSPAARARMHAHMSDPGLKQRWLAKAKRHVTAYFAGPHKSEQSSPVFPVPPELAEMRARADRERQETLRRHPELKGIYDDYANKVNPAQLQARLRLGIRVGRVSYADPGRAWVELVGRNTDGSLYRFSELYVKVGDRWLQRCPPLDSDAQQLPSSFAPPLQTLTWYRAHNLEKIISDPESFFAGIANAPLKWGQRKRSSPMGCSAEDC
jgi:hypothetical protein